MGAKWSGGPSSHPKEEKLEDYFVVPYVHLLYFIIALNNSKIYGSLVTHGFYSIVLYVYHCKRSAYLFCNHNNMRLSIVSYVVLIMDVSRIRMGSDSTSKINLHLGLIFEPDLDVLFRAHFVHAKFKFAQAATEAQELNANAPMHY